MENGVRKVIFLVREDEFTHEEFGDAVHEWAQAVQNQPTNLVNVSSYRIEQIT